MLQCMQEKSFSIIVLSIFCNFLMLHLDASSSRGLDIKITIDFLNPSFSQLRHICEHTLQTHTCVHLGVLADGWRYRGSDKNWVPRGLCQERKNPNHHAGSHRRSLSNFVRIPSNLHFLGAASAGAYRIKG